MQLCAETQDLSDVLRGFGRRHSRIARIVRCLALVLPIAGGLYALLVPLWGSSIFTWSYLGIFGITVAILYGRLPYKPQKPFPAPARFDPIGMPCREPFPREAELGEILRRLKSSEGGPFTILCGPSGVGKSTMAGLVKRDLEGRGWVVSEPVVEYEDIEELALGIHQSLISTRSSCHAAELNYNGGNPPPPARLPNCTLVVFDQFESFLIEANANLMNRFGSLIDRLASADSRVLIVVRDEFYSRLQFLKDKADLFKNTIRVGGMTLRTDSAAGIDLNRRLKDVVEDRGLRERVFEDLASSPQVLPLEVQMVGVMLEDINRELAENRQPSLTLDQYVGVYGGKKGLIDRYFTRYIDSSPDRDAATAVLCALSSEGRIRRRYEITDLVDITHRDRYAVDRVVHQLKDQGLIREAAHGKYELAHDYLAERYHELSGLLLDPVDRDNISFFSDKTRQAGHLRYHTRVSTAHLEWSGVSALFLLTAIGLLLRFFSPFLHIQWPWIAFLGGDNPFYAAPGYGLPFDIYYAPCFISSIACAWYVWRIHNNFLLCLPQRALPYVSLTISLVMVLLGTLNPRLWPLFAGTAGLVIAVALRAAAGPSRRSLVSQQVGSMRSLSYVVMFNMVGLIVLGLYFYYRMPSEATDRNALYLLDLGLAALVAVFMVAATRNHSSRYRGLILLSSLRRLTCPQETFPT